MTEREWRALTAEVNAAKSDAERERITDRWRVWRYLENHGADFAAMIHWRVGRSEKRLTVALDYLIAEGYVTTYERAVRGVPTTFYGRAKH